MKPVTNYSYTIDAIRIIGILLVILIHITGEYVNYPPFFENATWWAANIIDSASRIAVPLFVMISGYLLLSSTKEYTPFQYFKKRIERVGFPLVIWSVIYFIWTVFFWSGKFSVYSSVTAFLAAYPYYHLYFLYIILGLYIIAPIIKAWSNNVSGTNVLYYMIIFFVFSTSLYAVNYFLPEAKVNFNAFTSFLPYVSYFIAGYYLWGIRINFQKLCVLIGIYIVLLFVNSYLNNWFMHYVHWSNVTHENMNYSRYFYEHFSPLVVGMSIIMYVIIQNIPVIFHKIRNNIIKSFIVFTAPLVFGIYLVHVMVLELLERNVPIFNLEKVPQNMLFGSLIIKFISVLVISYIIVYICKKIKYFSQIWG